MSQLIASGWPNNIPDILWERDTTTVEHFSIVYCVACVGSSRNISAKIGDSADLSAETRGIEEIAPSIEKITVFTI
jgi:hypothetical protein